MEKKWFVSNLLKRVPWFVLADTLLRDFEPATACATITINTITDTTVSSTATSKPNSSDGSDSELNIPKK